MNIDERIEKIAERHKALAESVELLTHTPNKIDHCGKSNYQH